MVYFLNFRNLHLRVSFAAELGFEKILVPRLPQHSLNVNIECTRKSALLKQVELLVICDRFPRGLIHLNFIILILICFQLMMSGANYVIYDCSSARATPGISLYRILTLKENIVAVITQDRVRDDNLKRQIKNRTLCTRRLFVLT